jgi:hypothetical protein
VNGNVTDRIRKLKGEVGNFNTDFEVMAEYLM